MKLYYFDTLAPRKVCSFARHVGAPVEFVYVNLLKGEHRKPPYMAINPNGKVPAMTQGGKVMWEADAILCELAKAAAPDYLPDADQQIDLIRWFSWNSQHLNRWGGELYFQYLVRPRFGLGSPDEAAIAHALESWHSTAKVLNDHLAGRKWVMGDRPTIADFSLAVALPYAEGAHIPFKDYPEIHRWHDQMNGFDAWREPWPDLPAQAVA